MSRSPNEQNKFPCAFWFWPSRNPVRFHEKFMQPRRCLRRITTPKGLKLTMRFSNQVKSLCSSFKTWWVVLFFAVEQSPSTHQHIKKNPGYFLGSVSNIEAFHDSTLLLLACSVVTGCNYAWSEWDVTGGVTHDREDPFTPELNEHICLILFVETTDSCRFSIKPTQWFQRCNPFQTLRPLESARRGPFPSSHVVFHPHTKNAPILQESPDEPLRWPWLIPESPLGEFTIEA